jgi:hypothetical protein
MKPILHKCNFCFFFFVAQCDHWMTAAHVSSPAALAYRARHNWDSAKRVRQSIALHDRLSPRVYQQIVDDAHSGPEAYLEFLCFCLPTKDERDAQKGTTEFYDFVTRLYGDQQGLCALSGDVMTWGFGCASNISIDRIDSGGGYVPGNVRLVTVQVNRVLGCHGDAVCFAMLEAVVAYQETQPAAAAAAAAATTLEAAAVALEAREVAMDVEMLHLPPWASPAHWRDKQEVYRQWRVDRYLNYRTQLRFLLRVSRNTTPERREPKIFLAACAQVREHHGRCLVSGVPLEWTSVRGDETRRDVCMPVVVRTSNSKSWTPEATIVVCSWVATALMRSSKDDLLSLARRMLDMRAVSAAAAVK